METEAGLLGRSSALAPIARDARADHVLPRGASALGPRNHVFPMAVVGARGDDPYGSRSGSVYVFDLNNLLPATRTPEVTAGFNRDSRFASGTVSLTGFVIDDVPVRWV